MRLPNPWIGVPVAVAAAGGATVGFAVTAASCAPGRCLVPAVAVAIAVGVVAAVGVGVVVILALRSLAEFRESLDRDILTFVDHPAGDASTPAKEATTPTLTEANASHVDGIGAFLKSAWREAGAGAPGWVGATDDTIAALADPEAIGQRLGGPDRRAFVAETADDGIVAVAWTRRLEGDAAELAGIIVLQSKIGTGIGTPLLELAVSALAAEGCRRVVASTESANHRAIGFYTDRGFTEVETLTRDVEGAPVEVTILERLLDF